MAPDPPPTSATYYGFSSSATCYFTCDSTSSYYPRVDPVYTYDRLVRGFQKFLSDADKAILRQMNAKPTLEGIDNTTRFHLLALFVLGFTPWFAVRYDRRVPRWRSGRWKSLT